MNTSFTDLLKKRIENCNITYYVSLKHDELNSAQNRLLDALNSSLYKGEEFKAQLETVRGLISRIEIKKIAMDAIVENLQFDSVKAKNRLNTIKEKAGELGFEKTKKLAGDVISLIDSLCEIYKTGDELAQVCESSKGRSDISILNRAKTDIFKLHEKKDALPSEQEIFGKVAFYDIKKETGEYIDDLIEYVEGTRRGILEDRIKGHLEKITVPVPEAFYDYRFVPSISSNGNKMLVVLTPFKDELELLAYSYATQNGKRLSIINIDPSVFSGVGEDEIRELLSGYSLSNEVLCVTGLSMYHEANKEIILKCLYEIASSKKGIGVFIHEFNSANTVWLELERALPDANDIFYMYLTLPTYDDVLKVITEASVRPIDPVYIKNNCSFIGYVGVNMVVDALKEDYEADVTDIISRKFEENYSQTIAYMARLRSRSMLLHDSWGKRTEEEKSKSYRARKGFGGFDYDEQKLLNPKNIDTIIAMENVLLPAKCGLMVNYCLLCGDDKGAWQRLSDEEKNYRLTVATKTIGRLLETQYDPEVVVVEKIEGKAIAYCSGGGKQVVYSKKLLGDFDQLRKTICHEMYHSFQHTATTLGWTPWYFTELCVSDARVSEWIRCFQCYIQLDAQAEAYAVQSIEVDANIFALEAVAGIEKDWHRVKLVR